MSDCNLINKNNRWLRCFSSFFFVFCCCPPWWSCWTFDGAVHGQHLPPPTTPNYGPRLRFIREQRRKNERMNKRNNVETSIHFTLLSAFTSSTTFYSISTPTSYPSHDLTGFRRFSFFLQSSSLYSSLRNNPSLHPSLCINSSLICLYIYIVATMSSTTKPNNNKELHHHSKHHENRFIFQFSSYKVMSPLTPVAPTPQNQATRTIWPTLPAGNYRSI